MRQRGRHHFGAAALALSIAGTGVLAQTPQQTPQPSTSEGTVLRGCLRQGRADTTTANAKGIIYTLEVTSEKLPTSPPPEGSGPAKAAVIRYALSFDKSVDLSKHVNHRVEVKGRTMPRPGNTAAGGATDAKPLPGAAEQMFDVAAVTMLAAKCE